MAKYLLTGNQNLRLPADTDLGELRQRLDAVTAGSPGIQVTVEMNDDPLQRMQARVNPTALGWWAVVELADDGSNRVMG